MFFCALSSVPVSSSPALCSSTLYKKFSGNGSLKINWCTLCCTLMSQGPLKWVEKFPQFQRALKLALGTQRQWLILHWDAEEPCKRVVWCLGQWRVSPVPPQQGTAAGDIAGTEPRQGCWAVSQHSIHPAAIHPASGWHLPPATQIKAMQKDKGKVIHPSSKQHKGWVLG